MTPVSARIRARRADGRHSQGGDQPRNRLEDAERVTVAFLVGGAAVERGKQVTIFLTNGRQSASPCRATPRRSRVTAARRFARLVEQYADGGGSLLASPICFSARKLDQVSSSRTGKPGGATPSGSGSVMTARRSSATDLGAMLVAALTERDFGRLAGTLAPDVRMRALIPSGPVELSGAEPAAARFAFWFGESNGLELVHSGSDEVGDRLHASPAAGEEVRRPGEGHRTAPILRARRGPHHCPRSGAAQASVPIRPEPHRSLSAEGRRLA